MIRDLHETPALRKVPVETLVFNMIQDGGPILDHDDSEEQQRSLESTCQVLQIPERGAKLRSNQEAVEMTYEENPQTPRTGFPSYLESDIPSARLLLLSPIRNNQSEQSSYTLHP